tara:strand:+ start:4001 stop:4897 length:897 start_codon:yes stop_codon:yes gene_type:complete
MSDLTLTNQSDYNQISEAMGMTHDVKEKKKGSTLARMKIDHKGIVGETQVKGKTKKIEIVDAGSYRLELSDGMEIFQTDPKIRLFNQKFSYKKFIKGSGDVKNRYVKTLMANDLKSDLKDTDGGFNCGKTSGWIEDFASLPEDMKKLIKSIKRVRVLFGLVTFDKPVDNQGLDVDPQENIPFLWEIDNRDAFKIMGTPIGQMAKQNRILPQHFLQLNTEERSIPNGITYYLPTVELLPDVLELTKEDQQTFADFNLWIKNFNDWVDSEHEKAFENKDVDSDTKEIVDEFVDIEEPAAA